MYNREWTPRFKEIVRATARNSTIRAEWVAWWNYFWVPRQNVWHMLTCVMRYETFVADLGKDSEDERSRWLEKLTVGL